MVAGVGVVSSNGGISACSALPATVDSQATPSFLQPSPHASSLDPDNAACAAAMNATHSAHNLPAVPAYAHTYTTEPMPMSTLQHRYDLLVQRLRETEWEHARVIADYEVRVHRVCDAAGAVVQVLVDKLENRKESDSEGEE